MFERFTDRARRVVVLAQEEARLLNHNYIGTEHILLGLIHQGDGVAARALDSLEVSLAAVRAQVEEIIGHSSDVPVGHIPFTPRAKKVLELSLREALGLGHNYIGTEHLLLGLIREGEGVAAQVLVKLGANLETVRERVLVLLGNRPPESGTVMAATARPPFMGTPGVGRCVLCGRDLWEVERYVTAVTGTVCEPCITAAQQALQTATGPRGEVMMPPRVFGADPGDPDAAREIEHAFRAVFGGPMGKSDPAVSAPIEDDDAIKPYLAEAAERHAGIQITGARVGAIRFLGPDEADVRYSIQLGHMPQGVAFEGRAIRRDGRWLVSRDTMARHLSMAGIRLPPPDTATS